VFGQISLSISGEWLRWQKALHVNALEPTAQIRSEMPHEQHTCLTNPASLSIE